MKSEVVGRPSVVSDGWMILFKVLTQKFMKDGTSQFRDFYMNFYKFHEIIRVRLGYQKFCAKWVPKMLTSAPKMQGMASALTFLERYH
jgi:hypothetical protein